jgi:hypothetical protein
MKLMLFEDTSFLLKTIDRTGWKIYYYTESIYFFYWRYNSEIPYYWE